MNGQAWPWQNWGSQTTTQTWGGGQGAPTTDPEHATLSAQNQPSPPTPGFTESFTNLMKQFNQIGSNPTPSVFSGGRTSVYTQPQNGYRNSVPRVESSQDKKVYSAGNSFHVEFKGRSKPSSVDRGHSEFQAQSLDNTGQSPKNFDHTGQSPQKFDNIGQSQYQPDSNFVYQAVGSPNSGGGIQSASNQIYQSEAIQGINTYPTSSVDSGQSHSQSRAYQEPTNIQSQPQNTEAVNSVSANKQYLMQALLKQLQEQPMPVSRNAATNSINQQSQIFVESVGSSTGNNRLSTSQWPSNGQTNQQKHNTGTWKQNYKSNQPKSNIDPWLLNDQTNPPNLNAGQWVPNDQTNPSNTGSWLPPDQTNQPSNTGSWLPPDQTNQPSNTGSWLPPDQTNQPRPSTRSAIPKSVYQFHKNVDSLPSITTTKRNFVSNPVSYNRLQPTVATYVAPTSRYTPTEQNRLTQQHMFTEQTKNAQRQIPTEQSNIIQQAQTTYRSNQATRQTATERSNLVHQGRVKSDFIAALQRTMANQAGRNTEPKSTIESWKQTYIQQAPAPTNTNRILRVDTPKTRQVVHDFNKVEVTTNAGPIAQDYPSDGVPFLQQAKVTIQEEPKSNNFQIDRNRMSNIQRMQLNRQAELSKNLRSDASTFHQQLQAAGMNTLREPVTERPPVLHPLPPVVPTNHQTVRQNPQLPNNIKSGVWNIVSSFLKMQSLSDLKTLMKSPELLGSMQNANGNTGTLNIQHSKPQPYVPQPKVQFKPQTIIEQTVSKPSFTQLESPGNVKQLWTDGSSLNQMASKNSQVLNGAMGVGQVVAPQQQVWTNVGGMNEPAIQSQDWSGGSQKDHGLPTEQQMLNAGSLSPQLWKNANTHNLVPDTKQVQMLSSNFGPNLAVPDQSQSQGNGWTSALDLLHAASKVHGQSWTDTNALTQGIGSQPSSDVGSEYSVAMVDSPQTNSVQSVSSRNSVQSVSSRNSIQSVSSRNSVQSVSSSNKRRRPSDIVPLDTAGGVAVGISMKTAEVNKPYSDVGSAPSEPRFSSVSAGSYSDVKPKPQSETKTQNLRSAIGTAYQAKLNSPENEVKHQAVPKERFSSVGNEPLLTDKQSSNTRGKGVSGNKDTSYRSSFKSTAGGLDHIQEYVDLSGSSQKRENSLFPYRNGGMDLYTYKKKEPTTTTSAPWDNVYNPNPRKSKPTDIQELPPWEVAAVRDPQPIQKIPRPPSIGQNMSDSRRRGNPIREPLPISDSPASRGNNIPMPAPYWRPELGSSTPRDPRLGGREPWRPGPGAERPWGPGPTGPMSGPDTYNTSETHGGPKVQRMWSPDPYFSATTPPLPMPQNPPTPVPTTLPTTTTTTATITTAPSTTAATLPPPQPQVAPYVASGQPTNGRIPRPKPTGGKNKRPKKKYTGPLRIRPLKPGDPPNWDAFDVVGESIILRIDLYTFTTFINLNYWNVQSHVLKNVQNIQSGSCIRIDKIAVS